jgi:excisionase family DNA binding protein
MSVLDDKKLMTTEEVAKLPVLIDTHAAARILKCSEHYVGELCTRGDIQAVRIGRRWRINTAALLRKLGVSEEVNA